MPDNAARAAPYILRDGEERQPVGYIGGTIRLLAGGADTANTVTVSEGMLNKGGPPFHVHDVHDEMLFVIEGKLVVRIGDSTDEVPAGGFAWLPHGIPHTFANPSDTLARVMSVSTPGGIEDFLNATADYFGSLKGPPDIAKLAEIGAAHSARTLGPPIQV